MPSLQQGLGALRLHANGIDADLNTGAIGGRKPNRQGGRQILQNPAVAQPIRPCSPANHDPLGKSRQELTPFPQGTLAPHQVPAKGNLESGQIQTIRHRLRPIPVIRAAVEPERHPWREQLGPRPLKLGETFILEKQGHRVDGLPPELFEGLGQRRQDRAITPGSIRDQ